MQIADMIEITIKLRDRGFPWFEKIDGKISVNPNQIASFTETEFWLHKGVEFYLINNSQWFFTKMSYDEFKKLITCP